MFLENFAIQSYQNQKELTSRIEKLLATMIKKKVRNTNRTKEKTVSWTIQIPQGGGFPHSETRKEENFQARRYFPFPLTNTTLQEFRIDQAIQTKLKIDINPQHRSECPTNIHTKFDQKIRLPKYHKRLSGTQVQLITYNKTVRWTKKKSVYKSTTKGNCRVCTLWSLWIDRQTLRNKDNKSQKPRNSQKSYETLNN